MFNIFEKVQKDRQRLTEKSGNMDRAYIGNMIYFIDNFLIDKAKI